jgi:hypothetical protein
MGGKRRACYNLDKYTVDPISQTCDDILAPDRKLLNQSVKYQEVWETNPLLLKSNRMQGSTNKLHRHRTLANRLFPLTPLMYLLKKTCNAASIPPTH